MWVAAQAHSTSVWRSQGLPLPVLPERRLPADSSLPGESRTQLAQWAELGKQVMSGPSSARITSAEARPTPVIVSKSSSSCAKGAIVSAIASERRPIASSR